jgi:hypothetical protein
MLIILIHFLLNKCELALQDFGGEYIPKDIDNINRGFIIIESGCRIASSVTLNDSTIPNSDRKDFSDPGNYEINNDGSTRSINIIVNQDQKVTHVVIISVATHPLLLDMIDFFTGEEVILPTYFYQDRGGTFNISELSLSLKGTGNSEKLVEFLDGGIISSTFPENVILGIYRKNHNAFVHFYCDDMRWHFELLMLRNQGINPWNYKTTISSDGTGTYNLPKTAYDGNDGITKWKENQYKYQVLVDISSKGLLKEKLVELTGVTVEIAETGTQAPFYHMQFFPSVEPNHNFYVLHPDSLVSSKPEINEFLRSINFVPDNPQNKLEELKRSNE